MENKPVMLPGAVKRIIQGNQRRVFSKQDAVLVTRRQVLLAAGVQCEKIGPTNVSKAISEFAVNARISCWNLEATSWRR